MNNTSKFLPGPKVTGNIIEKGMEVKTLPNGKKYIKFTVAYKEVYKDKDGNKKEGEVFFFNCEAWGEKNIEAIERAKELKLWMDIDATPKDESWDDKATGQKRKKTVWTTKYIRAWKWESGEAHLVDLNETEAPY